MTTRFGSFYTLDIDASLPATRRTLPLEEFLVACEQGRSMRKQAERGEWDNVQKLPPAEQSGFEKVPLAKVWVNQCCGS